MMTKNEFITELRNALSPAEERIREEILADINEHFYEGMAQGRSEEEICKSLGQPGSIARQVLEEIGQQQQNTGWGNVNATGQTQQSWDNQANDDDFDKIFTGVESVNAKIDVGNLQLLPSDNGNFRVVVEGLSGSEKYSVENHGGELRIIVKLSFRWFRFPMFGSRVKVTVYVPAQFAGRIKIDSTCGNIKATDTSGEIKFSAAAGNITVDNHHANNVNVECAAGNAKIRLANKFAESVKIESSAGNIDFEAAETGKLKVSVSAGNGSIRVLKLSGETKIESAAGNVKLTTTDIRGNVRLESAVGSIKAYMPANVNCRIDAPKPSIGSLKNQIVGNSDSPYTLRARGEVGSVQLLAL